MRHIQALAPVPLNFIKNRTTTVMLAGRDKGGLKIDTHRRIAECCCCCLFLYLPHHIHRLLLMSIDERKLVFQINNQTEVANQASQTTLACLPVAFSATVAVSAEARAKSYLIEQD